MNIEYQADDRLFRKSFLLINVICLILILLISIRLNSSFELVFSILFVVNVAILYSFNRTPNRILIKQNKVFFYFRFKSFKCFSIDELDSSFDQELVSRAVKEPVLKIYVKQKLYIKIRTNISGYSELDLSTIHKTLSKL